MTSIAIDATLAFTAPELLPEIQAAKMARYGAHFITGADIAAHVAIGASEEQTVFDLGCSIAGDLIFDVVAIAVLA